MFLSQFRIALQLFELTCILRQQRRYQKDVAPGRWEYAVTRTFDAGPSMVMFLVDNPYMV